MWKKWPKWDRKHWLHRNAGSKIAAFLKKALRLLCSTSRVAVASDHIKVSKTVLKGKQHCEKLVLSAVSGWEAGKGRHTSLFLLLIVTVQIHYCEITWEDSERPYRQLVKVTALELFMGLETSITDLWHHDCFRSQLRFSLLQYKYSIVGKSVLGKNTRNARVKRHTLFYTRKGMRLPLTRGKCQCY